MKSVLLFWSLLFTISFLASSCGGDDADPLAPPNPPIPRLMGSVEAAPLPNQYQVHLTWNLNTSETGWVLQRQEASNAAKPIAFLKTETKEYLDSTVSAGQSYHYFLAPKNQPSVVEEVQVIIPIDLEVTGIQELKVAPQINRLFFHPGAHLYTMGRDLEIDVNEIYSDEGTLAIFPPDARGLIGHRGRNGGRVVVKAKVAHGVLHVIAQGEGGGAGLKGHPGMDIPKPGAAGNNGQCGFHDKESICQTLTKQQFVGFQYLAKTDPDINGETARVFLSHFYCRAQTGDGAPGVQGEAGEKGGSGFAGGNSGLLSVQVDHATDFQITTESIAGRGGPGGDGGDGGPGGPGGAAGVNDSFGICRVASPGPNGAPGIPGARGETGSEGIVQAFCLRLGTNQSGDCSPF